MQFTESITNLDNYKNYLADIGKVPTYQLDKCFACGLPAVWLYMKALGLEEEYFNILQKVKNRSVLFKELFYLLILTNKHNKYFPQVPKDFLKIEIPKSVLEAQIELAEPEFEMAFTFNANELKETLQKIALPNKMVRLGNRKKAIGLMQKDNKFHVYHADNPSALEFKDLDACVELIIRTIQ